MSTDEEGELIRVRGQVQGVGFRPFVWRLARDFALRGTVRNDGEGVLIEVWGEASVRDAFAEGLRDQAPPLSRVDAVERQTHAAVVPAGFEIIASAGGRARTGVTPDAATCPACLAEISDPSERRFGYAFTNCTHCGPRFSIVTGVPYDRASTTMASFELCGDCAAEYADPADRRFHAQPIACPVCGPTLWLEHGTMRDTAKPIEHAAALLRDGLIVAIKGIGGFHLACDATNEAALARLRQRKHRPAKPFALMARDLAGLARYADVGEAAAQALGNPAAPIVLLPAHGGALPDAVAPGQTRHGWMLPYTPLHHLLMAQVDVPLVMTSGNPSGQPQAIDNDAARDGLHGIADAFLMHDRPIARRLDDSVVMMAAGGPRVLRRARGMVPSALALPEGFEGTPTVTAWGGQMKGALCIAGRGEGLLGHHLGELDEPLSWQAALQAERDYAALFNHTAALIACDAHPDYRTTRQAEAQATALGVPLVRVQHHHAHIAATMVEAGWPLDGGAVLGVALDGLGWGEDGTVWGGEFLLCTYRSFERVGSLKPVALPGGEAAQREPWRNLWAHLTAAGIDARDVLPGKPLDTLAAMAAKGLNTPMTTSAGRLFDAVAALTGLAPDRLSFEGEAAMALEAAAARHGTAPPYAFGMADGLLDPAPMWHAALEDLRGGASAGYVGARFHAGLVAAVRGMAMELAQVHGASAIALGGGVFQNTTLLEAMMPDWPLPLLAPAAVPAGDGGLALGQAAVAMAMHA